MLTVTYGDQNVFKAGASQEKIHTQFSDKCIKTFCESVTINSLVIFFNPLPWSLTEVNKLRDTREVSSSGGQIPTKPSSSPVPWGSFLKKSWFTKGLVQHLPEVSWKNTEQFLLWKWTLHSFERKSNMLQVKLVSIGKCFGNQNSKRHNYS